MVIERLNVHLGSAVPGIPIAHGMSAVSVDCKLIVGSGFSASPGVNVPAGDGVDATVPAEGTGVMAVAIGETDSLWTKAIME
jgi:hypothetical protein